MLTIKNPFLSSRLIGSFIMFINISMEKMFKLVCIGALFWSAVSYATPYQSINPSIFGPDVDGNGYFSHNGSVSIAVEAFDAFDTNLDQKFEFGIYFENSPNTLITLFDSFEPTESVALIDFTDGAVVDLDDSVVESTFIPSVSDFGFYLSIFNTQGVTPVLETTVYSDAALNNGVDLFGAFELLTPDVPPGTLTSMFFSAPPEDKSGALLYIAPLITVSKAASVSEPYTLALFGLGLTLLVSLKKRRIA